MQLFKTKVKVKETQCTSAAHQQTTACLKHFLPWSLTEVTLSSCRQTYQVYKYTYNTDIAHSISSRPDRKGFSSRRNVCMSESLGVKTLLVGAFCLAGDAFYLLVSEECLVHGAKHRVARCLVHTICLYQAEVHTTYMHTKSARIRRNVLGAYHTRPWRSTAGGSTTQ